MFIKPFLQGRMQGQRNGENQRGGFKNPFQKEGDVTIISKPKDGKTNDDGMGDYIDYEEIKD